MMIVMNITATTTLILIMIMLTIILITITILIIIILMIMYRKKFFYFRVISMLSVNQQTLKGHQKWVSEENKEKNILYLRHIMYDNKYYI